jgi:hypothetical protein
MKILKMKKIMQDLGIIENLNWNTSWNL